MLHRSGRRKPLWGQRIGHYRGVRPTRLRLQTACSTAGHGRSRVKKSERLASGHRVEPSARALNVPGLAPTADLGSRIRHTSESRRHPPNAPRHRTRGLPRPAHHPHRQRRRRPHDVLPSRRAPTANCCLPPWPSCWTTTTNDAPSVHGPGANTALKPGTRSRFRTILCQQTPSCWQRT